ncbi:MAG: hypothetical protein NTW25_12860 [Candidatus Kapabacteria bacterium]|nr:hypothetical protein [Candidatus Kapabacteria bacterium]
MNIIHLNFRTHLKYFNKNIVNAELNIYGETGQSNIYFEFSKPIKVKEKQYYYPNGITKSSEKNGIILKNQNTYIIDSNGNISPKNNQNILEVYKYFQNNIPFHLK